jgi:hypothetical protein
MGRSEEIIYMSIQNIMNQEIALRNLERRQAFDIAVQTVEDMLSKSKELNIKYPSSESIPLP